MTSYVMRSYGPTSFDNDYAYWERYTDTDRQTEYQADTLTKIVLAIETGALMPSGKCFFNHSYQPSSNFAQIT